MARKTTPQPPTPDPELRVSREEAAKKIGERIVLGEELLARSISNAEQLEAAENEYRRWNSYNAELLKRLFTTDKFAEEYSWWGAVAISMYGIKAAAAEKLRPRARQNVVLELGFFVGKLGRKHVCALYKGPLELPSDYMGVGYVLLDDGGGWRLQLAKELPGAGFSVDMNQAV